MTFSKTIPLIENTKLKSQCGILTQNFRMESTDKFSALITIQYTYEKLDFISSVYLDKLKKYLEDTESCIVHLFTR